MKEEQNFFSVLTLRDTIVFPQMIIPLFVGREKSVNALDYAVNSNNCKILLLTQIDGAVDTPEPNDLYKVGVVANVIQFLKLPDGAVKILVKGENRAEVIEYIDDDFCLNAKVKIIDTQANVSGENNEEKIEALKRSVLNEFDVWNKLSKKIQLEALASIYQIKDICHIADVITSHLSIKLEDKQKILEISNLEERLEKIYIYIKSEINVLNTQKRIKNRVKSQMENVQRTYYLNEQLKAIQKEIDESDGNTDPDTANDFEKRINETPLSAEAKEKALSDLKRYKRMNPMSPEATVISSYLHWLLDLPWGKYTKNKIDLDYATNVLNENHYGMDKVKDRVIEFLAVLKRVKKLKGPIICLVGPPGVGKTSLAKSIAKATSRNFVRMSLGGMRDESEIRGHRRTYIGSMPGKIIQQIKKAKSCNPLFLLDEIDKLGSDFRGDPASALLEVLDPEHNKHFSDHYMEVEFDLSKIMFIATANSLNLPRALIDRMEIVQLSGYTEDEKINIARQHLIPKLYKENGLKDTEWEISDDALRSLIRLYTRESGVRGLEKQLTNLMRKAVKEILINKTKSITITENNIKQYLGIRKYTFGVIEDEDLVGVVTGLAYTEVGGDILVIESVLMPGKGDIKFTGKLGEVMQESVKAAYSYVRSRSLVFGITSKKFQKNDIHIHVPEGAIPKDGPSAGIAMCTSIVSLMTGIPINKYVAMTGEVTLRGRVLAIGGLKEKLLAALRGGIKTVIIPKQNEKDVEEIPDNIKERLNLVFVSNVDEVINIALTKPVTPLDQDDIYDSSTAGNTNNDSSNVMPDLLQH